MNPEIKAKWIADLRANPDLQGRTYLRRTRDGKFCCMGRLCEIMGIEFNHDIEGYIFYSVIENSPFSRNGQIPITVLGRFFLTEKDQDTLIGMNDRGKTFAEIADWIEENL
jgi:hypothetical protein